MISAGAVSASVIAVNRDEENSVSRNSPVVTPEYRSTALAGGAASTATG